MGKFLNARFDCITPYVPGEQPKGSYVKLNANETSVPPSPRVAEALDRPLIEALGRYADPHARPLKRAVAQALGVDERAVFVGNGSDEVLGFLFLTCLDQGDELAFPDISYGFYRDYATTFGLAGTEIPLTDNFEIDIAKFEAFPGPVVFANPNAPTGLALSPDEIERIVQAQPDRLVVVDEAYVDYGAESCVPLVERYENLVVVQTLSKSRNLAGAHIGFAVAHPGLVQDMEDIRFSFNPFTMSALTQAVGVAAMGDEAYLRQCAEAIVQQRERLGDELSQRGFEVMPSLTNFLFVRHDCFPQDSLAKALKSRGILIRHFDQPRITDWNRITVGTASEIDALLLALDDALAEVQALPGRGVEHGNA
ncbi:MAG: histidinol-phosphate transaminase [Eggerthellaceae bacterium]|nr:histidinol-phosphate transaminase [Eggerthellaceae bacterium]